MHLLLILPQRLGKGRIGPCVRSHAGAANVGIPRTAGGAVTSVVGSRDTAALGELLLVGVRVDEGGAARAGLGQGVVGVAAEMNGEGVEAEDEVDLWVRTSQRKREGEAADESSP